MQELYGIFDREHVIGLLFINFVDDSRQGGRFAGAGGACHQHDCIAQLHNLPQFGRQVQRCEVWDLTRNYPHHDGAGAALHKYVDPKPMCTRQAVGHVAGTELLQVINRLLVAANEIGPNAPRIVIRKDSRRSGRGQFSTNLHERWLPG